jgi:nucleotide-binding universal stress UspA family protein
MKNIFIATDFTPASKNAALYGIELAKHYNAKVYLFHAFQNQKAKTGSLIHGDDDINLKQLSREWLTEQAAFLNENGSVNLEMCSGEGAAADAIIENALAKKADLIICAMKGTAKVFRKIFGSVTLSLIDKSNIPLIVVPDSVAFQKPTNIALAMDIDPATSPATLQLLKNVGENFYSKVSVVYALKENFNEDDVVKFSPPVNISEITHLYPKYEFRVGNDIVKTIESFTNEQAVNMLAIIPHKHTRTERWFTKSVTKELVFQANLPVLVLPQKIDVINDVDEERERAKEIWKDLEVKKESYHC